MTALQTSREIGIAMGVLMQKYKITRDEAFSLLRMASQALHRKLALIAVEVAETGELPEAPPPKRRDQPS
jgi:AmiR/NasT family two-component response regulator